jgi:hypothetical protein
VLLAAHARIVVADDVKPVAYAVPETTPTVATAARPSFVDRRSELNRMSSPPSSERAGMARGSKVRGGSNRPLTEAGAADARRRTGGRGPSVQAEVPEAHLEAAVRLTLHVVSGGEPKPTL